MSSKTIIYTGLFIGSSIGGFIPTLWGDSAFSITAVLLSAVFGIVGIIIGYRISNT